MDLQINISNINTHFFTNKNHSIIDEMRNKPKYCNLIVKYSNLTLNEARICHKIQNIPYYSNYFSILEDNEELNISELSDNIIRKLTTENGEKYYLFKYKNCKYIDFTDFLYDSTNFKKLIFDLLNALEHLLNGLLILNSNNIYLFNFSPENIIFQEHYREKPVFRNFRYSILSYKLDYDYILPILNSIKDYTYLPFEVHLLFCIMENQLETISYSFIEDFCENYMENCSILQLFSESYRKNYKEQCILTMRRYINQPKKDIIEDILERSENWDIYGISLLFIKLFSSITNVLNLKGTILNTIPIFLSRNLHPDSDRRLTIQDSISKLREFIGETTNWHIFNNIDNKKLPELFAEFNK